jgi:hypothetical protein
MRFGSLFAGIEAIDLAWAAGYFDGEGSVSIPLQKKRWPYLQVCVSSKDERPVSRMKVLFGGALHKDGRSGGCWKWIIQTKQAGEFLFVIRPFLRCKDIAADVGIELSSLSTPRGTRSVPESNTKRRIELRLKIRKINERN